MHTQQRVLIKTKCFSEREKRRERRFKLKCNSLLCVHTAFDPVLAANACFQLVVVCILSPSFNFERAGEAELVQVEV